MQTQLDFDRKSANWKPREPTSRNGISVLHQLQVGVQLTPWNARDLCKVVCLSQEIGRLKKLGWLIQTAPILLSNGKRCSRYWL